MHRHRKLAAGAVAPLLLTMLALTGCPKDPAEHRVAILFTTDEHSQVFALAPEVDDWPLATAAGTGALKGGMARRATLIAQQKAAMADTVVLSSGDSTQGTLSTVPFPLANFDHQLMKAAGYDAVALGNHEFDQTPRGLAMAVSAATAAGSAGAPQLVLSNIAFSASSAADDTLAALYGPGKPIAPSHVVTTPGGIKVGIVAAMGLSAAADCAPFAAPVTFTGDLPTTDAGALASIASQVQAAVDSLHADAQVDVVVLLSHGGLLESGAGNEAADLAVRLTGVDLILGGHSHAAPQPALFVNDHEGHRVAVLQDGPFGAQLGRAELVWNDGQRAKLDTDPARTTYLAVDDRTLPTTSATVVGLINAMVGSLSVPTTAPSFLEQTLYAVLGTPVAYDPASPGGLYFHPLGHTTFPIQGLRTYESNLLNLDTDAMLWSANTFGGPTKVALQARGAMRADLLPGKTGTLSFADVYRAAPLGLDPTDGTPGYPILRFLMAPAELRAALEGTLLKDLEDHDFFVSPSGLKVKFDRTRAMWDQTNPGGPGWITYMATVAADGTATPFYDVTLSASGWLLDPVSPLNMIPVAATYQLAAFAASLGIAPRDPTTGAPVSAANLSTLFIRRIGGSAVKDHQSLASFVAASCAGNGGELPSIYDATTAAGAIPRRMICQGAACP